MSVTPARRSDAARPYALPRDRPVSHGRLFTAEGLVLVLLAALASYAPARRASRVDPVEVMRGA